MGYDALKPFETAVADHYFPYTHNWQAMASLNAGAALILEEGLEDCFARHEKVAGYCRQRVAALGLSLFPAGDAVPSPTVTAVNLPPGRDWAGFDRALREKGLVTAGSYGPLAGKVFRLGHMGSQADMDLVGQALQTLQVPKGCLVAMLTRDDQSFVPDEATVLKEGDRLLVIGEKRGLASLEDIYGDDQ